LISQFPDESVVVGKGINFTAGVDCSILRELMSSMGRGQCRNPTFDRTQATIEFRDQHLSSSEERRSTSWEA
jgi:hypothetical protein